MKHKEKASAWTLAIAKHSKEYKPKPVFPMKEYKRDTSKSVIGTGFACCSKQERNKYTGDAMIGIGTLHKSNAVPIFSTEEAINISAMRRG